MSKLPAFIGNKGHPRGGGRFVVCDGPPVAPISRAPSPKGLSGSCLVIDSGAWELVTPIDCEVKENLH